MKEKIKFNIEALKSMAKPVDLVAEEQRKWLAKNALWLKETGIIAFRILTELKNRKMSQTDLALIMDKTPQYIRRVVKGHENLTFSSIKQFEAALGISLI
jgi:ribosome-binding protein aMBF1 (putative translation factor)